MSSQRIASLRRVLALCLTQERGAKLAMAQSVQRVTLMAKRLESLELRQASGPVSARRENSLVGAEDLLSSEALTLMRERILHALRAARLERNQHEREWMERHKTMEQVRGVLNRLEMEIDRIMQRHEQQEIDDLYAARQLSRRKDQP
ncbi:hypothetical protein [Terriglobus saanensis]|uniref:Flagellar FliJ protein n=1 Tax=Terriglobus saanensis (strain ATCC BAA-1853 / DSM 23119 / SP1PR4) TaxID=401053 RepID=E8V4Z4_TERSS|nr:hypothetical protein [Terriglobus saanensis]ADV82622.1 hypothetical protein AciPR4_1816 [Terriglobus saanensis SP1PR4]